MDIQTLKSLSKEDAFKWASSFSGIPADVLDGLWAAESNRGKNRLSPAGAVGDFQIMPWTKALFEKQFGHPVDTEDFHESLYLAAHHLKADLKREKGDLTRALRAYNNGPDWEKKADPRGENAQYAQRVLAAAGRTPEAAQHETAQLQLNRAVASGQITTTAMPGLDFEAQVEASAAAERADQARKQQATTGALAAEVFTDARANAWQWLNDLSEKPQGDVRFDYYNWEGRAELEAQAKTPQELMFLRENVNAPDAGEWALAQLETYRAKDKVYGDYGATENFLVQAGVLVADPVGGAIGLGASKALGVSRAALRSMAGTSSRAAVAGRMVGSAAAEGAVGNVGWEAFQDLTGQVKTFEDYALSAAIGAGLGASLSPLGVRSALRELEPQMVGHVEAFRQAEVARVAALDQTARQADPVAQGQIVGDLVDAGRVGGNSRRTTDKVIPDELLTRSVDEDAPDVPDPVVVEAAATLPVRREPAPRAAVDDADALEAALDEVEVVDTAAIESRIAALDVEREALLKDGKLPKRGTKARQRYDAIMEKELPEAQEQMLLAYDRANGELYAPRTEGLEPLRDGEGRVSQPVAQETLLDALVQARKSKDAGTKDLAEAVNALLRYGNHGVLRNTTVNYVPGARGVWRPEWAGLNPNEIVTPGDLRGGAGLEGGRLRVLVHEAFHAVTAQTLRRVIDLGAAAPAPQRAAVERLHTIFGEFRAELGNRGVRAGGDAGASYAAGDIKEFVSQAMMDPETQRILSSMKGDKYGAPTLWDKFWQAVTQVLGLAMDRGTALYDVMKQVEVLVRTQGNLPDNVVLREPMELRSGAEPVAVRSTRDSNFFRQLYEHARTWNQKNPVDAAKLDTLANRYTSGAVRDTAVSDGLKMASSKNPIVRMLSGLIVETTTGAAGRRTTADLLNHLYGHRIIGSSVNEFDHAALAWVRKNKGGWIERLTSGKVDQQFNRLVMEEIVRRRYGQKAAVDAEVTAAADAMQRLFQRSLDQQKQSGTLGSAWLPDDAVGYVPQALQGDAIRSMTPDEKRALQSKLAQHWGATYKWDDRFAEEFAHHYITRAQREAAGERHVDHVATNGATSVIKDTLAEMRLEMRSLDARTSAELEKVGGAPYTKHRLDVPLLDTLPNGKKLLDYYDTDVLKLARNHARSVAGQAALAEHNILGQRGANNLLRAIREAEPQDAALPEEIAAVERTFSAFLGTPWHGEHRNRLASGLAGFTRLRLMGGLAFTQLGELANGLHHVGMGATMEATASLPRLFSEVKDSIKGKANANKWLGTIDRFSGYELGTEQYRMSSAFDAPDDLLREYGKGSNIVERAIHSGNYAQAKVSFFRGLQAAQHRAFAEQIVIKAVDYLRANDASSNRYLEDMGFNSAMRKALRGKLDAAVMTDAAGNAVGFDVFKLDSTELMEDFVAAVNRGTAQIIQNTFVGEKGAWAHSDFQKLAFQLRTFGLTATEKQWARNRMLAGSGVEGYAFAAGVLVAQMAFVTPIYLARLHANGIGRDDREEYIEQGLKPAALVQAMMNYSSAGGLAGDAFDTVASLAGGWSDELKQDLGVKSFGNGLSGLVPGTGTVDQAMRVARGDGSVTQAIKLLPFSNLPYVQAVINQTR